MPDPVPDELVEVAARALAAMLDTTPFDEGNARTDRETAKAILGAVSTAGWVQREESA